MTKRAPETLQNTRETNRLVLHNILLPTIFLTVTLLGGLRVEAGTRALVFVAPPLVTLVLAVMLMGVFVRGRLIELRAWFSDATPLVETVANVLTLLSLFFASAQAFNSVLPEAGLFRLVFSFFFLWTLWQSQFAPSDPRRTLRSVAALFGTAFVLKHLILASLNDPEGGWLRRVAAALLEGVTQGTVGEQQTFAPATGYISFFTLVLYVVGLTLTPSVPERAGLIVEPIIEDHRHLSAAESPPLVRDALGAGEVDDSSH